MYLRYQSLLLILAASLLVLLIFLNGSVKKELAQVPVSTPKGVLKSFLSSIAKKDEDWTLLVTGDVMLGRTVMTTSLEKNDPSYPFRQVGEKLASSDVTFINLENPIIANCPKKETGFIFCADPKMLEGLNYAGIDVVTLANNHSRNYGEKGLTETKTYLSDAGISFTENDLKVMEVKGIKVGFIGLDLVDKKLTEEILGFVSHANSQVDVLVLAPHWGIEYKSMSSKTQQDYAKKLVENGADIIVGSHPHWVQENTYISGKPVYYSLGNFIFDQPWSEETKKGMAVKFSFKGKELVQEEKLPIYMKNHAQPEWVE